MDYGSIDVLSTSQGRPTADASLGVTYRAIWGRPDDVKTLFGNVLRMSSGCIFAEWVLTTLRKVHFTTYLKLLCLNFLCSMKNFMNNIMA